MKILQAEHYKINGDKFYIKIKLFGKIWTMQEWHVFVINPIEHLKNMKAEEYIFKSFMRNYCQ